MLKRKIVLGFAAALTASAALATVAQARDLTVVSWGGAYQDAQKKVYFEPFKKASGIPMNDESWDGGVGVLRAKVQGGAATWDVVQVESDELAVGCEEGLFEKMDYSKIGGEAAYIPPSVNPCGVGAILYDFVLGYDKDKLKDALRARYAPRLSLSTISVARYFAAHLLKRSVRRSMFSSQKATLISTAFLMLSGAVGRSFSTAGCSRAAASLFEVP